MFEMNLFDKILYDGTGKKTVDVTAAFSFAGTIDSSLDVGIAFGPGSYTLDKTHSLFGILSRGLQNKRLFYQSEEVISNMAFVLPRKEKYSKPITIVNVQKNYLNTTVPISESNHEYIEKKIKVVQPHDETINNIKVRVIQSHDETINNMLNIYNDTIFVKELPFAIASFGKKFEAKQNTKDFGVKRFKDFEIKKVEKTVFVRR